MTVYGVLHYRGNLTAAVTEGQLLGCDEFGRPYAVIDAEYDVGADRTAVHVQYATPEQIKAALS